jgi:chloride channel protein, CIC family
MTEKIARRGVKTPDSYESDILARTTAGQVLKENGLVLNEHNKIGEVREWQKKEQALGSDYFIVASAENVFRGIVSASDINSHLQDSKTQIGEIMYNSYEPVSADSTLRAAIEMMIEKDTEALPVVSGEQKITGVLSYTDILSAYKADRDNSNRASAISIKRQALKMLIRGNQLAVTIKRKN